MKKYFSLGVAVLVAGLFIFMPAVQAATDTIPPSTPTVISASLTTSRQIYVSWNTSTDNVGVIGYYLYRNGQFIANTPGYTYYTDEPGAGTFTYTVAAYDSSGNTSPQSSATTPITITKDTTPPSAPGSISATVSSSSIVLSWAGSTDNVGVVGYYVSRNGGQIATAGPITGSSYTDSGLTPGTTYRYAVTAYDAAGNVSSPITISATTVLDVTPPSVPTSLSATAVSPSQVNLTWQPSTDNISVAGYTVYRNSIAIGNAPSSSYEDTGVASQKTYSYSVAAYDEVNNISKTSNPVTVTTPAPDTQPPSIPANLTAVATSPSAVTLSWQPSTDNVGVTGYYIYRNSVQIGSTASTSYYDTGLATSTTYDYAVIAHDAANNLAPQTSVGVTTLAHMPSAPTSTPAATTSLPTMTSYVPPTAVEPQPIVTTPISPTLPTNSITTNLSYGSRGFVVINLQNFLVNQNYLPSIDATGFYGSLTQKAVQSYQCAQRIVCSGSPSTTGWGRVGAKTRAAINATL